MRHCLLFLYNKDNAISGRAAAKQLEEVYGEEAPSHRMCAKWLKRFKEGTKDMDDLSDDERVGRPITFDEDRLRDMIEGDPRLTIRELAHEFGCSIGSMHKHLHSIGKVIQTLMPKF